MAARSSGFEFPATRTETLCTKCATPTPADAEARAECGDEFINPVTPAVMSLFHPGLSDLYLGHRTLVVFELLGFGLLLLLLLFLGSLATGDPTRIVTTVIMLLAANVIDSILTLHVARKGKLPKRLAWKR